MCLFTSRMTWAPVLKTVSADLVEASQMPNKTASESDPMSVGTEDSLGVLTRTILVGLADCRNTLRTSFTLTFQPMETTRVRMMLSVMVLAVGLSV